MKDTDSLISSLAESMPAPRRMAHPFAWFLTWFAGCLLYVALLLAFEGFRDDITLKFHTPLFVLEVASLLLLIITCALAAAALSYPDLHQKSWLAGLPVIPLGLFILALFLEWQDTPHEPVPAHGIECLMCITVFTLLPGAWMLFILRKQATTHYYMAGSVAVMAACGIGCLTLRLSEKTDSMPHLLIWHYLPMTGFAVMGLLLGRRFLKW